MTDLPPCPPTLRAIQHYLTLAKEHASRDVVVSYWCHLYALQEGIKIDKNSVEARNLLGALMGRLESTKEAQKDNEAIIHDIPAQAYLENYALKLFLHADQQDRAGIFNKNVVKIFFKSSLIYGLLEIFGELTEEVVKNQKYAKWKATYINNCLKNGETPVAGPLDGAENEEFDLNAIPYDDEDITGADPKKKAGDVNPGYPQQGFINPRAGPSVPNVSLPKTPMKPPAIAPDPIKPNKPAGVTPVPKPAAPQPTNVSQPAHDGVAQNPEIIAKAQKYCKFATSALNYDDVVTAVTNLEKALALLTTGHET